MRIIGRILLFTLPLLLLQGCETLGKAEKEAEPDVKVEERAAAEAEAAAAAEATAAQAREEAAARAAQAAAGFQGHPLDDPASLLAKRVFYFDFDSSEVAAADREAIAAHAAYLAQNRNAAMRLEGHADERGSREYNVGLAERRAMSVRRLLLLQGAGTGQLETVSYGEERPVALGHDEASWRLNRRVEMIYSRR